MSAPTALPPTSQTGVALPPLDLDAHLAPLPTGHAPAPATGSGVAGFAPEPCAAAPAPRHPSPTGWSVSSAAVGPRSHFDPLLAFDQYFPTTRCFIDSFETQLAMELSKPRKRKIEFEKKFPSLRGVLASEIAAYGQAVKKSVHCAEAEWHEHDRQQRLKMQEQKQTIAKLAREVYEWRKLPVAQCLPPLRWNENGDIMPFKVPFQTSKSPRVAVPSSDNAAPACIDLTIEEELEKLLKDQDICDLLGTPRPLSPHSLSLPPDSPPPPPPRFGSPPPHSFGVSQFMPISPAFV